MPSLYIAAKLQSFFKADKILQKCDHRLLCRYIVSGSLNGRVGLWPVEELYRQAMLGMSSSCSQELPALDDDSEAACRHPPPFWSLGCLLNKSCMLMHNLCDETMRPQVKAEPSVKVLRSFGFHLITAPDLHVLHICGVQLVHGAFCPHEARMIFKLTYTLLEVNVCLISLQYRNIL